MHISMSQEYKRSRGGEHKLPPRPRPPPPSVASTRRRGSPALARRSPPLWPAAVEEKVGMEGCEIYPSFGPMLATAPLTGLPSTRPLAIAPPAGVAVRLGGGVSHPSSIRDAPPRCPQLLFVVPLFADSLSPFLSPILGRHFSSPLCVVVKEARVYN
ncbi:hypothetical protein Sjap_021898 [Stephania japonica]|uniref:Uncharacterized protein n=1 Tax=Stephania japonica TaxID=461633 RepID=A0AAP0ENB1_9MAGN